MIYGTGCDLVEINRIMKLLKQFPQRLPARLLSQSEQIALAKRTTAARRAAFIAKRFAAKEAFVKALGLGLSGGMRWTEIAVVSDHHGRPEIHCSGNAAKKLADKRITRCHLSLSDERQYAMAYVILEQL